MSRSLVHTSEEERNARGKAGTNNYFTINARNYRTLGTEWMLPFQLGACKYKPRNPPSSKCPSSIGQVRHNAAEYKALERAQSYVREGRMR